MRVRVLVADDNESVKRAICVILQNELEVDVCATTSDGLQTVMKALDLRPDLIVLDLKMPRLNGLEIAGLLKKHLPGTQMVLFTMFAEAVSSSTASLLGVPVISKTDGLSSLVEVVKAAVSSSRRDTGIRRPKAA